MEVCSKSVMETQFLHFCITGYEIRALTISLLHLKMVHYDWIEEETHHFFLLVIKAKNETEVLSIKQMFLTGSDFMRIASCTFHTVR